MQESFGFAGNDLGAWRARLGPIALPGRRRTPVGQLIKSSISSRTRDAVSTAAYGRLTGHYASIADLSHAGPAEVERLIGDVTYPEDKAIHLLQALRMIADDDGGFDLAHLATRPLADALAWLERLPGVARKVSASTLNASTLARPVMIVDTHVLRVLRRLGFVSSKADYQAASEAVTGAAPRWSGDDFLAFHIALKRMGQQVCRWDVPKCGMCPLAGDCPTARRRSLCG